MKKIGIKFFEFSFKVGMNCDFRKKYSTNKTAGLVTMYSYVIASSAVFC